MRLIFSKALVTILVIVAAVLIVCATWPVADNYPRHVAQTQKGPVEYTLAEYSHTNIPGSELWAAPTWSHMISGPEAAAVATKVVEFLKN